jgi:signal transduction histidine kinase
VDRVSAKTRHLIFLAHIWICTPFLIYWLTTPSARWLIPAENFEKLRVFIALVCVYILVRSVLAFKDPPWLKWQFVFPPIDVAIISTLLWLGDRDPISKTALLYFFPVAEAAGSLSVAWAATVGGTVLLGAGLATHGFRTDDPFNTAFQYFFILLMASLLAALAKASARGREQLGVAKDRSRIAMEMHDGVQGHLITIASQLELAQRMAGADPAKTAKLAEESKDTARLAADELRFLVQRLRAPSLSSGFLPALKQFAHNQADRNGLDLEFLVEEEPYDLPADIENALFRIAQESLTNVLRHAQAKNVRVQVSFRPNAVALVIRDDGVGFDSTLYEEDELGTHAGLDGMAARAKELGGTFVVASKPCGGTSVEVVLPRTIRGREKNRA